MMGEVVWGRGEFCFAKLFLSANYANYTNYMAVDRTLAKGCSKTQDRSLPFCQEAQQQIVEMLGLVALVR